MDRQFLRTSLTQAIVASLCVALSVGLAPARTLAQAVADAGGPATRGVSGEATNPPNVVAQAVRFRLSNGLNVILEENHLVPQVAVRLRVHVGSRDDPANYTGLAHTVEHMMFERIQSGQEPYFRRVAQLGATGVNGTTSRDSSDFFSVIPSHNLAPLLWLESDRLAFLLEGLTEIRLLAEQRAIRNEYEERMSSGVIGYLNRYIHTALYHRLHPYRHIDEYAEDLPAIRVNEVVWFFQQWYVPANTTLVLVGDFSIATVRPLIESYFSHILGAAPLAPPLGSSQAAAENTITLTARLPRPWVAVYWATPRYLSNDDAALDVAAELLAGHPGAALFARFARENQASASLQANQLSHEVQSEFRVVAEVLPGRTHLDVVRLLNDELDHFKANPISVEDLNVARRVRLQRLATSQLTIEARAEQLARYASFSRTLADLSTQDRQRYAQVTPTSVHDAMVNWLDHNHQLTVIVQRPNRPPSERATGARSRAPAAASRTPPQQERR